jgi:hypothetical protein
MGRKIKGLWYRRAWAEDTKSAAEHEMARMEKGSPHHRHVLVSEVIVHRPTGKETKMYSIYFRPKQFKNTKERQDWSRISQEFRREDSRQRTHGNQSYWKLGR